MVTHRDTADHPILRPLVEQNIVFRKAIRLSLMNRVDEWFTSMVASTVISAYLAGVAQADHWHRGHGLNADESRELLVALTGFGSQVAALSHVSDCDSIVYALRLLIHENVQNIASVIAKTTHTKGLEVTSDAAVPHLVAPITIRGLAEKVHFNSSSAHKKFVEICERAELDTIGDIVIFAAIERATEFSTAHTKASLDMQAIVDDASFQRAVSTARLAGVDGVLPELRIAVSRTLVAGDAPMPAAAVFKLLGEVRSRAMAKGMECRLA